MPSLPLLKPALYCTSDDDTPPALLGGRCTCGYIFFPMQTYGCEKCGRYGEALASQALSSEGRLLASATVHIHMGKDRVAPFVVGSIILDDGLIVRTLVIEDGEPLSLGDRMTGILVPVRLDETGEEFVDFRFKPQRERASA